MHYRRFPLTRAFFCDYGAVGRVVSRAYARSINHRICQKKNGIFFFAVSRLWLNQLPKLAKIDPSRRIQRVAIDMNLSYQPVTYSVSTHPNLQFQRWKSRHPTGIHLAVALEVRAFFDVSGYWAYQNRIFGVSFILKLKLGPVLTSVQVWTHIDPY